MQLPHHMARMTDEGQVAAPVPVHAPGGGCFFCDDPAQTEHTPCCSTHARPLCCNHYSRSHFLNPDCTPATHARQAATS